MGGSTAPNGVKGWGRVLLQNVLPTKGEGDTTMYFNDKAMAKSGETTDYVVTVSAGWSTVD